jgi:ComF family protein
VHEAKYHGNEHAFTLLASALVEYLSDGDIGRFDQMRIIPIPLGKARRAERGFNQTEEIARRAGRTIPLTIDAALLERTRETPSQVSLERHLREENMRGAFKATREADPAAFYLIIDDVLTTGATLQAAIDALTQAGATHCVPLALAH